MGFAEMLSHDSRRVAPDRVPGPPKLGTLDPPGWC